VNLAMTRLYGRAPKGERVVGSVPQNYGQNVTVWAALGPQGLQAMMTVEGATDAEVFRAYVTQVLGPTLAPGDIVVLDNLGAHKVEGQDGLAHREGADPRSTRDRTAPGPGDRQRWRCTSLVQALRLCPTLNRKLL
jgi:hypothetical protein